ncbi:hypothetical protein IU448_16625 [Nocardia flavorosea]|uniref:hypothetical protein n=1 Tax=Nocardia flavorosea TaxID=53429 RepID=UPI0018953B87|nr:hypothetical protein [Nocardia flavorosea]MBF6350628.1 hypothetical protein [Nocardia flavorosea]
MSDENPGVFGQFGPSMGVAPESMEDRISGQQSLAGAQHVGSQVSHGGQDPAYITRMELFEGLSHEEIHSKVQDMFPGVMHSVADIYQSIANSLGGALFGSLISIQRELSEGMAGEFADAANRASRTFFDQATDVQEVLNAVGMRIHAAAYGAEVVKKSVPPPPTQGAAPGGTAVTTSVNDPAQIAQTVVGAADPAAQAAFDAYKEDQRLAAVEVMNTAYKPTYQPAGEGVPTFVPVQMPGDLPGPTVSNGSTTSGPAGTTPGPGTQAPNGENPGQHETGEQPAETPGSADEPRTTTAGTTENPTTAQQPGTTPGSPAGDPQRTTPSTTTSGSPGVPAGTPGSPGMPGGAPPQNQAPGKTVPGAPGGTPNSPAGGPGTAAAAGTGRAMSGMPGMMSPGAGARRGEGDDEHKVPDYLVHEREDELFGARPRLLDGVLGGDAPAAQPADDRGERR